MEYFGSEPFRFYLERLPAGLQGTLLVAAGAIVLGVAIGLLLASLSLVRLGPTARVAQALVAIGRSVPIFPLLLVIYFGFLAFGIKASPLFVGALAIGFHIGPYLAESFRAGIQAVPPRLVEAGYGLGMSPALVRRRVVLPIAARILIPTIGQYTVSSVLSTAAISTIGAAELTNMTRNIIDIYFAIELWIVVAITYFLIAFPLSRLFGFLERRYTVSW